jgi:hypothetical protein
MESIIDAAGRVTNFYALAAVGIIAFVFLLFTMIRNGQLSKLGSKDSYRYITRGTILLFCIILVSMALGYRTKDVSNKAATNATGDNPPDTPSIDDRDASQDIIPQRRSPQPAQTPAPPIIVTGSPTPQNTPTQGRDNSSTTRTQQVPPQPLTQPAQPSKATSEAQEQVDPVLLEGLQALRNLSDRGVRIERGFSLQEGTEYCVSQFQTWRGDCVRVLNQVDDHFDRLGRPTDFSHYFDSNASQLVSSHNLKLFSAEESFNQCRSGFQTAAQSLLSAIELDIKLKADGINN